MVFRLQNERFTAKLIRQEKEKGQLLRLELRYIIPHTKVLPLNYSYLYILILYKNKWDRTESNSRSLKHYSYNITLITNIRTIPLNNI